MLPALVLLGGALVGLACAVLVDRLYVRRTRRRPLDLRDAELIVERAGPIIAREIAKLEAERDRLRQHRDNGSPR